MVGRMRFERMTIALKVRLYLYIVFNNQHLATPDKTKQSDIKPWFNLSWRIWKLRFGYGTLTQGEWIKLAWSVTVVYKTIRSCK